MQSWSTLSKYWNTSIHNAYHWLRQTDGFLSCRVTRSDPQRCVSSKYCLLGINIPTRFFIETRERSTGRVCITKTEQIRANGTIGSCVSLRLLRIYGSVTKPLTETRPHHTPEFQNPLCADSTLLLRSTTVEDSTSGLVHPSFEPSLHRGPGADEGIPGHARPSSSPNQAD